MIAFDRGWLVMMAITALSFIPLIVFLRQKREAAPVDRSIAIQG